MNREKIIEAIIAEYRKHGPSYQTGILREALKHIASDTNLIAFAIEVGVDTHAVLAEEVRS